jgi:hypothetical protein
VTLVPTDLPPAGVGGTWLLAGTRAGVRAPLIWAASALSVGLVVWGTWWEAPVLPRIQAALAAAALVPGCAAFLTTARFSRRVGMREHTVCATPGRDVAMVFGSTGVVVGSAVVWIAAMILGMVSALARQPVGGPTIAFADAALNVVACGALGGLIGARLASERALVSASAAFAAIVFVIGRISPVIGQVKIGWLLPSPELSSSLPGIEVVPPELALRPHGLHALYLFGIALACLTLTRTARSLVKPLALAAVGTVAAVLVASAVVPMTRAPDGQSPIATSESSHRCVVVDQIEACALTAYARWADEWKMLAAAVLAEIPVDSRLPVTIVQAPLRSQRTLTWDGTLRMVTTTSAPQGSIRTGVWWSRETSKEVSAAQRFGLTFSVAASQVNLPTTMDPRAAYAEGELCHVGGQARAVVAFWLAAVSDERSRAQLQLWVDQAQNPGDPADPLISGEYYSWYPMQVFAREARLALQLADQGAAAEAGIRANWNHLTDPSTPTSDISSVLGQQVAASSPAEYEGYGRPCP